MKVNCNKVKKVTLLMALLAPMIYLFGSLFEALKGSNGEITLAQPVYVVEWVETNSVVSDSSYKLVVNDNLGYFSWLQEAYLSSPNSTSNLGFYGTFRNTFYKRLYLSSSFLTLFPEFGDNTGNVSLVKNGVVVDNLLPWEFYFDVENPSNLSLFFNASYCSLYVSTPVPSDTVVVSPQANNDYLFSQFFTQNNFLAESGRKVLNGVADYGFAPAGDMIRFIDSNMFHLANVEYGALVIGYTYYAFHVVCVFLIFNLLMFFPHLIENIYEKFERGW